MKKPDSKKKTMRFIRQQKKEADLNKSADSNNPPSEKTSKFQSEDNTNTRNYSKKAVKKAHAEAKGEAKPSRLQFTAEEREIPELEPYIRKAEKAADKAEKAVSKTPKSKKIRKKRIYDEAKNKGKTRLQFEESEKPYTPKTNVNPVFTRPVHEAGIYIHRQIRSVEKENSGVEGAHRTEEAAERLAYKGVRKLHQAQENRKLKPYRKAASLEQKATKANAEYVYRKAVYENPPTGSNPISRMWQKRRIKQQYAKAFKSGGASAVKGADNARKAVKNTRNTATFIARHGKWAIPVIGIAFFLVMLFSGLSAAPTALSGAINTIIGTSYTSEDEDLVEVNNEYTYLENALQIRIDNIEEEYPGYDEYRYDLAGIYHNPHELAAYLTTLLQSYTLESARSEMRRFFDNQYSLRVTETIEIRYYTDTYTDENGETQTESVPYEYYILNVKLTNTHPSVFVPQLLNEEQLAMFNVYRETSGNKPLVFGGGSPGGAVSEDLRGVHFENGIRTGNQEVIDLALAQVGNVGGQPYWSWYGFNSRVEWCACFVSWCYGQMGLSEPKFAACQLQGIPWFSSHGQWADRNYSDIAPGDAIFFDWQGDGHADHVGLVIGKDNERVYTVEGNSGDACAIRSYPIGSSLIVGYGLMNWD